jgi:hypothetical protein
MFKTIKNNFAKLEEYVLCTDEGRNKKLRDKIILKVKKALEKEEIVERPKVVMTARE